MQAEAAHLQRSYGKAWKEGYQRANPLASEEEAKARVNALIDQKLREGGTFSDEVIARRNAPARGIPDLPPEAVLSEHTAESFARNIDARDRGAVATALNEKLNLGAASHEDVEKQVNVKEAIWGDQSAGFPQVLEFQTKPNMKRGVYEKPVQAGLVFADKLRSGAVLDSTEVHVLEYQKVEEMMNALHDDPLYKPLLESKRFFTLKHEQVLNSLHNAPDKFGSAPYFHLNNALRDTSPYPLDTLLEINDYFFPEAKKVIDQLSNVNFSKFLGGSDGYLGVINEWKSGRLGHEVKKQFVKMIAENVTTISPVTVKRVLKCYFEDPNKREEFMTFLEEALTK